MKPKIEIIETSPYNWFVRWHGSVTTNGKRGETKINVPPRILECMRWEQGERLIFDPDPNTDTITIKRNPEKPVGWKMFNYKFMMESDWAKAVKKLEKARGRWPGDVASGSVYFEAKKLWEAMGFDWTTFTNDLLRNKKEFLESNPEHAKKLERSEILRRKLMDGKISPGKLKELKKLNEDIKKFDTRKWIKKKLSRQNFMVKDRSKTGNRKINRQAPGGI